MGVRNLRSSSTILGSGNSVKADTFSGSCVMLSGVTMRSRNVTYDFPRTYLEVFICIPQSSGILSSDAPNAESELVKELKIQKVCEARRIKIKRNGQLIPTKPIILTFGTPQLRKTILAGYARYKIHPYIPTPLRCFVRGSTIRKTLAEVNRLVPIVPLSDTPAQNATQTKCVNCVRPHTSDSKECNKSKMGKKIQNN
ncbi:hypothetical protein HNY73_002598 [Argiope bruennichi]|uniref:Uncharacterized protein n=1 Tax=Argiope bruennichi TaxID=94029 RepID=A0A8T0FWI7_ARGBR|nr:hypothetical protein HNY73_002598 [Argiope bruennichi]